MTKLITALALAAATTLATAALAPTPAVACGGYGVSERDRAEWAITDAIAARGHTVDRVWVSLHGADRATVRVEWHTTAGARRTQAVAMHKRGGAWRVHRWGAAQRLAAPAAASPRADRVAGR